MSFQSRSRVTVLILFLFTLLVGCQESEDLYFEEGVKEINGTQLYYKILGDGEPIVVLHGGPGLDHSYFLPQMSELAQSHRLIFFDQRLSGRSSADVDSSAVSMDHFVEDLEGIRQAFELDRMNLMAHSWGGVLAMFYVRKYPQNLKSLILVSTSPGSSELQQQSIPLLTSRFTQEDSLARIEVLRSEDFKRRAASAMSDLFRIGFRAVFFNRNLVDSLTLQLPPSFAANSAKLRFLFNDLASYDLHADLAMLTCPVLILHGDSDVIVPGALEKIRDNIRDCRIVMLENCGHFPFIEAPGQFFREVRNFLAP